MEGMEDFYIAFKEKRVIHAEAQFDEQTFKTACPDIYHQIGTRNWGPFTILVDPYLPKLVWEFYASYRARKQLMKRRGNTEAGSCLTSVWVQGQEVPVTPEAINSIYWDEPIPSHPIFRKSGEQSNSIPMDSQLDCKRLMPSLNTSKVPIKVSIFFACIMDHVHINMGEIIANQFKCKAKQQATALAFPNLVCMLCMRATCPMFRPLDRMVQANSVITLATKTDKAAPAMKRAKYTRNMTLPSSLASIHTATAPLYTVEPQSSPPPDLLNIAQRAKMHENQLLRLAKALPSMIQGAIKKALQPAKDKLASLFSTVDVLECKVGTLKQEVVALTAPSSVSQPNPCEHEEVPKAPKSPPDDWWISYDSESEQVPNKEPHHSRPPPPPMHSLYDVDPSWTPGGVATMSYHKLRTLPKNWVVQAQDNLYPFHRIHNNRRTKRQLLGSLMLPLILGDPSLITNLIKQHLSLAYLFFGCIGGNVCFQFGGGLILVR
ncbi:hypothetical protein HAX54_027421 [Datura stramonium]|uniref:Putative plant transposon protein domain-containing protein n=1 Tax=Datura stramonium TaxID=4076 RepID=A0ABS8S8Q0_DATST|nr:hypothetical protein [Datura stramonium]